MKSTKQNKLCVRKITVKLTHKKCPIFSHFLSIKMAISAIQFISLKLINLQGCITLAFKLNITTVNHNKNSTFRFFKSTRRIKNCGSRK